MIVVWLKSGVRTRDNQLDYIAEDNPSAALRIEAAIDRHAGLLAQNPEIGRVGRVPTTRELVVARTPFILIYRVRSKRVEILNVLHGAQRWPPESGK